MREWKKEKKKKGYDKRKKEPRYLLRIQYELMTNQDRTKVLPFK